MIPIGIFYLSGLGTSPGATLVPLHYIYLMMKMADNNNEKALEFFKSSGEIGQEKKGTPEYIIIFTSKEVIQAKIKPRNLSDQWFNLNPNNMNSIPKIIVKSLYTLIKECSLESLCKDTWIKGIYFIEVDFKDFNDCYEKIYTTIKAIATKEVWINLIGGSNQITLSLFLASCLTGIGTKYIYIFQQDISKIHPEINKPNFKNPNIEIPPKNWVELPFFWIGLESEVLQDIEHCFGSSQFANLKQIKTVLKNYSISTQYLAKLQTSNLIHIEKGDRVKKGLGFDIIKNFKIENNVTNFSEWLDWAKNKDILYEANMYSPFEVSKVI